MRLKDKKSRAKRRIKQGLRKRDGREEEEGRQRPAGRRRSGSNSSSSSGEVAVVKKKKVPSELFAVPSTCLRFALVCIRE